jgi:hypothetical protein
MSAELFVRDRNRPPTRRLRGMVVAGVLAVAASSCASDSPLSPTSGTPVPAPPTPGVIVLNGRLNATVDGTPWQTPAVITLYLPSSFTLSAPLLSTPESLVVSAPLLAGTQSVTTDSLDFYLHNFLIVAGSWRASQRMPGSSGTLTLTEATADRVAGTFSFTAVATAPGVIPAARTVTAGSFDTSR